MLVSGKTAVVFQNFIFHSSISSLGIKFFRSIFAKWVMGRRRFKRLLYPVTTDQCKKIESEKSDDSIHSSHFLLLKINLNQSSGVGAIGE